MSLVTLFVVAFGRYLKQKYSQFTTQEPFQIYGVVLVPSIQTYGLGGGLSSAALCLDVDTTEVSCRIHSYILITEANKMHYFSTLFW